MDHCSLQGIFCGDACLLACALGDALLPAISLASKAEPHWVIMFQFSMLKRPHAAQRVAVQLQRPCRNGDPPGSSARIPRGGRLRTPRPGWQRHSVRQPRFILFKKPHRYCADESSAGAPCPVQVLFLISPRSSGHGSALAGHIWNRTIQEVNGYLSSSLRRLSWSHNQ